MSKVKTWPVAEFFRSGATDRVCQAIYPYIFNDGQEGETELAARKSTLEIIRKKFGGQFLSSFAAARSPQRHGGAYDVLHWLDKLQVPLDEMDSNEQTPLFYAAREANYEAIAFLLQRGAKAERLDHNRQNVLFYAAKSDPKQDGTRVECDYRKKVMPGAKVHTRKDIRKDLDANGRPHKKNRLAVVEILVDYRADPTHQDELARSPLDYARDDEMIRLLEAKCTQWQERRNSATPWSTPAPVALPQVEAPCMYLSKLGAVYGGQYMLAYSDGQDVESLVQLESEFIEDHAQIIERMHGTPAPPAEVCRSVGVHPKGTERKRIIKSITGQRNRFDCTMKVMHINAYAEGASQNRQAVCHRLVRPAKVVGYMYQKVDGAQADGALPDSSSGIVEVSHLKVSQAFLRRGLATLMFCGLVSHLSSSSKEGEELRPMQLSVFDRNEAACRLYEKLGFEVFGESWDSELTGWGGPLDPVRSIRWRRYRRHIPGETRQQALAAFEAFFPAPETWKDPLRQPGAAVINGLDSIPEPPAKHARTS